MYLAANQRVLEFKRIAVLTDLGSDSKKIVGYAASLARWYESELLLAHACPPGFYATMPAGPLPSWPVSGLPEQQGAENELKRLVDDLDLQDLAPKVIIREATIGNILKQLDEYHPSLLLMATHGREGIQKFLLGSTAEAVFRKVQWPVLVLGPNFEQREKVVRTPFQRILYSTDFSEVSVMALEHAAAITHDHGAQLTALYVEPDPEQGSSLDPIVTQQRLRDWLQEHIDGLSEALAGVDYLIDFGKPQLKITEAAKKLDADLVVLGARGLGSISGPASHFVGGTAYEVACSSKCPVLIVPEPA